MLFDRVWIETELAGLVIKRAEISGMISVLEQMLGQLNENGAGQTAPAELSLTQLQAMLPEGHQIEGEVQPHVD